MQSFLELVARRDVAVEPLITHRFPIEEAESAYQVVTGARPEPAIAIVLAYNDEAPTASRIELSPARSSVTRDSVRCGIIGAGQFARGVLLPALVAQDGVHLQAVCTASGLTSRHVGSRYQARYATSDAGEIFADPDVDAVVIATRHDQHAGLASAALRAGKAVFVEKPLALTDASLAEVFEAVRSSGNDRLMVGFNRRFAPLARKCREFFAAVTEPLFISYRVNAGVLADDNWALDPVEGGGRILGEVCHFVDTICYLGGALPGRVFAEEVATGARRGVTVTLRLTNGSVGVIHYLTTGDAAVPKEYVEVFGGGRTAQLDNFRTLSLYRNNRRRKQRLLNQAKGHAEEAAAFITAVKKGGPMPIDIASIMAVTGATFMIGRSLETGGPVECQPLNAVLDQHHE